jgi:hypothetical protein
MPKRQCQSKQPMCLDTQGTRTQSTAIIMTVVSDHWIDFIRTRRVLLFKEEHHHDG